MVSIGSARDSQRRFVPSTSLFGDDDEEPSAARAVPSTRSLAPLMPRKVRAVDTSFEDDFSLGSSRGVRSLPSTPVPSSSSAPARRTKRQETKEPEASAPANPAETAAPAEGSATKAEAAPAAANVAADAPAKQISKLQAAVAANVAADAQAKQISKSNAPVEANVAADPQSKQISKPQVPVAADPPASCSTLAASVPPAVAETPRQSVEGATSCAQIPEKGKEVAEAETAAAGVVEASLGRKKAARKASSEGRPAKKPRRRVSGGPQEAVPGPADYKTRPAVTRKRARKEEASQKKPAHAKAEATEQASKAVPYGANFVKQDMRRFKNTSASKGGTAASRARSKYMGKDGRLKPKYSRPEEAASGAPMSKRAEKEQRFQNLRNVAMAQKSLLRLGHGKKEMAVFSSAVSADLLSSIREEQDAGLGDISESRPPDAFAKEPGGEGDQAAPAPEPKMPPLDRPPEEYTASDLTAVLQCKFGHQGFRPGQQEAMSAVLARQHTLLLLSTGSGKSLCYQLPAYLLREEGLTLVVSPLISLMSDQLMRLPSCLRGAVISGQQSREQSKEVMRAVRARLVDVLFVSPERLSMWSFDGCGLPPIALACVDEAHCVSEWSHNFRPDYLRLHEFLIGSLGARRLLALTATATRPTIKSVCDILRLQTIVRSDRSFTLEELLTEPAQPRVQRSNLSMNARIVPDEDFQVRELLTLFKSEEHCRDPAIVYVWKRATADQLAKQLQSQIKGGIRAYHGSMVPEARRAVQEAFMSGQIRVVVATVAFGMGLDKPNIRTVVHFGMPKSIENYIQETGRCSRDGAPGKCIALVTPKDYKTMRWLESGAGGGGTQANVVRRLLSMLLRADAQGPWSRFNLSEEAIALAREQAGEQAAAGAGSFKPYCIAFDEKEAAREMNCSHDELHSVLAHLSRHARGQVALLSNFPTKIKLRFFRTDPAELAQEDALLRKVMPLAKKVGPVYSIETAKALAEMGGSAGQLSNGLWQARGDEFSVEKADYGYMVSVLGPVDEAQLEDWSAHISGINAQAREHAVEKLDAAFIALSRAQEAAEKSKDTDPASALTAADTTLASLIDAYFAATEDPSGVVAGDGEVRRRLLSSALGQEYRTPSFQSSPQYLHEPAAVAHDKAEKASTTPEISREQLEAGVVCAAVARVIMGPDWPSLPSEDVDSIAHVMAQFLAGINSTVMPAKKWREHKFWGRFKGIGDFAHLEELVRAAVVKCQGLKKTKR